MASSTPIELKSKQSSRQNNAATPCRSPWTPSRSELDDILGDVPKFRASQLWDGLYINGKHPGEQTNLPKDLKLKLAEQFSPALTVANKQLADNDKTVKWAWKLADGNLIETVLMHYSERSTVCVSSQAGCAMGCGFCATGQAGYKRNLSVGEILEQFVQARQAAAPRRLSNIVFMGMGEPMANYPVVLEATNRLMADFKIGARRITISTIGLIPQIIKLADEGLQVGLAVSLHSANDEDRTKLVPINQRHPIAKLVEACKYFRDKTGRRVSFEWAMISDTNDRDQDANELAKIAKAAQAHINLIPLNPTPGWPTVGSSKTRVNQFADLLTSLGANVTVRANRGTDIDAACGQLAATATPS